MKHHRTSLLAVAITAALALPMAHAQQGSAGGTTAPGTASQPGARAMPAEGGASGTLSQSDRQFVMQAAMAGMAEVQAGELAAQKSSSPQARAFAQRMVEDHTKANQQLMTLAKARGVTPPDELDRTHRQAMERLQKLSGTEFDRAYMKNQIDDHQKAVSLYEQQAKNGRDAELKSFATRQLPTLREHLEMARNDARQLDAAAGRGTGSTSANRTPGGSMTGSGSGSGGASSASGSSR